MKKTKSIIALILALVLALPLVLTSCGAKDDNNIAEDECIIKIGEHKISYGLYRYFFLNYKDAYTKEELETNPAAIYKKIEEECIESLIGMYAVVDLCAEYGIKTDDKDIKEKVDATIASIKEQYISESDKNGEEGYKEQLKANHLTENIFRFVCAVDMCEESLFMKLTTDGKTIISDDDTVRASIERDFIRILQVYINTESTKLTYDEAKTLAESVCKKAKEGVDFNTLVAENSNDYSMQKDGYYMPRGWMSEEMDAAAFALEIGEVSDVVELSDGFHIIKRFEMEDEYIEGHFEELKERYQTCKFYQIVDEREKTLKADKQSIFSEIDPALIAIN